jgi:hypothetical protein
MPHGLRSFGSVAEADETGTGCAAATGCDASAGGAEGCDGLGSAAVPDAGTVGVGWSEGVAVDGCAAGVDEAGTVGLGAVGACTRGVCGTGASGARVAGAAGAGDIAGGWMTLCGMAGTVAAGAVCGTAGELDGA